MPSFRILNQAPQYLLANGNVNAGGKLFFYETDLTTPKNTWSDPDMTTLNANPVEMDAAGRTTTDVWGDGEYGVVMTDADEATIWTRNNVKASNAEQLVLPTLQEGEVWLGDGAGSVVPGTITGLPDPSGHAGDIVYTDGAIYFLAAPPETPETPDPDIVVGPSYRFQAGSSDDNTKLVTLCGTGTAPNTGTKDSSVAIAFGEQFDALWNVHVTITQTDLTPAGCGAVIAVTGWTQGSAANGCTVNFNIPDDDTNANFKFSTTIPFAWTAIGTQEVVPE